MHPLILLMQLLLRRVSLDAQRMHLVALYSMHSGETRARMARRSMRDGRLLCIIVYNKENGTFCKDSQ